MRRSKGPAVKAWVFNKLKQLNPTALVTYGLVKYPESTWIMLGDVSWPSAQWVTNRSREEEVSVTVVFNVQMADGGAVEAEAEVMDLAASFEEALMANPSLDGLVITSNIQPTDLKSWPIATGFEGQYEIEVVARCRP